MLFAKSGSHDFPSFVAQESCGLQQLLKIIDDQTNLREGEPVYWVLC